MTMLFELQKTCFQRESLTLRFDTTKKSKVYFDASLFAACGVLTQDKEVIACASKTLNKLSKNYQLLKKNYLLSNLLATI